MSREEAIKHDKPNCNTCIHNHGENLECDVYACMFEPYKAESEEV